MTNPYQLIFTLKQHTPIIHFQHHQHGATLRATELKPKLDQFIIRQMGGWEQVPKEWKAPSSEEDKKALNYKIKIESSDDRTYFLPLALSLYSRNKRNREKNVLDYLNDYLGKEVVPIAPTPYFANEDKIKYLPPDRERVDPDKTNLDELRLAVLSNQDIQVTIFSLAPSLIKEIKKYLPVFFVKNNFGTRQNKGFGSFTVHSIESEVINSKVIADQTFHKKNNPADRNNKRIFEFIHAEYLLLKSGKNHGGYEKSKLFEHFIDKKIRWEKRYIKQQINSNKIQGKNLYSESPPIGIADASRSDYNAWQDKQNNNYHYIRALLGLGEQFEYTVFGRNGQTPDFNMKYLVGIEHKPVSGKKEDKIERFKSPLFFKVIDDIIYINYDSSYEKILGETFEFTLKLKGDRSKTKLPLGQLTIPSFFNIKEFMDNSLSNKWINTKHK